MRFRRSKCRKRQPNRATRLLGSLPHQLRGAAGRGRWHVILQLLAGYGKLPILFGTFPIGVHRVLDLECDDAVADRVAAPMWIAAHNRRLVLFRRSVSAAVASELGPFGAAEL